MRPRMLCLGLVPALSLAACSTTHEFRVAEVGGDSGEAATEAAAAPEGAAPLIVASGNILLGRSGMLATANPSPSAAGIASGTVSGVLATSGQTVVRLADGPAVLVDGLGGALGEAVSVDLAQGQVVGAAQSVIANNVVSSSAGTVAAAVPPLGTATSAAGKIVGGATASTKLPPNAGRLLTMQPSVTTVAQPPISAVSGAVAGTIGRKCC